MQIAQAVWSIILSNKLKAAAVVVALLLIVGVARAMRSDTSSTQSITETAVAEVKKGPLRISVDVSGQVKTKEQEIIKNEVEGQTTLLWVIPEGQQVKEGDLLAELDASSLQDNLVDREISVLNAEASYVSAREGLEVVKNQAQSDVDQAELDYRFAKEDLANYIDGEFPIELKEAETNVSLSTAEFKQATEELEGSKRLAEKNFISKMELEADEQAAMKAKLDLELAEERRELLKNFTYTRKITELESEVKQTEMALDRVKRKATADVVEAESDLSAKKAQFDREQGKLDKLKEQLVKTKLYAPTSGLVVYATTGQMDRRGSTEPLQEGQTIRERQELIYLPPPTPQIIANVKVHESSLAKIAVDMPALLNVEAVPGVTFKGKVTFIAPLPDASSMWLNPDLKVYNTTIELEGDCSMLKTGMTCRGEIIVTEYPDALYIPVQSVVRVAGEPTVYINENGKITTRAIQIGLDNNRQVHVLAGLEPGEQVLLTPPLRDSGKENESVVSDTTEGNASETETASPPNGTTTPPTQTTPPLPAAPPSENPTQQTQAPNPSVNSGGENMGGGPEGAPGGGDMRRRMENATPEEREQMRQQFEERMKNMTPEEREQMRQRMGNRRQGMDGGAPGERGGAPGGGNGGNSAGPGRPE